jgi:hypothetical protein
MKGFVMVAGVAILVGAGCAAKRHAAKPARTVGRPELAQAWHSTPLPARAEPTAVKEGAAPLVYLVEGGALIRVRDASANRDLARSFVPARAIVRVDGRQGVIYGQDTVFAGPLPEGHRYVIFVDPTGENVARQGTVRPPPARAR